MGFCFRLTREIYMKWMIAYSHSSTSKATSTVGEYTECWAGVVVGKQSERPPPSPGLQLQSPHLSWVILICQNCLPACLQGYYWCVMREQIGNEKHTNGRWKKQRWEEERGWVDNVGGSFMQKEAGNDLLFHLFLRINYAKMLIGDIMNFSICYE